MYFWKDMSEKITITDRQNRDNNYYEVAINMSTKPEFLVAKGENNVR